MTSYENHKVSDRIVAQYVNRRTGGDPSKIPDVLTNKIIHKSRAGEIGQIVVRKYTGTVENKASIALQKFVANIDSSHGEIAETMMASKTLPKGMRRVAEALLDPKNK